MFGFIKYKMLISTLALTVCWGGPAMVGSRKSVLLLLIVTGGELGGTLEAGARGPGGMTGEVVDLGEAEVSHTPEAGGHTPVGASAGLGGKVTSHELLEEVALLDRHAGRDAAIPHVHHMLTGPAARSEEISGKSRLRS